MVPLKVLTLVVAGPMTHDLMLDALTNLDARVDSMVIYGSKGQMFFAHLVLSQGGRLITLDARPSDAIALALRQDAPLYIEETVLDASSFPFLFKGEKQTEEELSFICDNITEPAKSVCGRDLLQRRFRL